MKFDLPGPEGLGGGAESYLSLDFELQVLDHGPEALRGPDRQGFSGRNEVGDERPVAADLDGVAVAGVCTASARVSNLRISTPLPPSSTNAPGSGFKSALAAPQPHRAVPTAGERVTRREKTRGLDPLLMTFETMELFSGLQVPQVDLECLPQQRK